GDVHGLLGREAELARGLLLQGGRGERGGRVAPHRLLLHRRDAERPTLDSRLDGAGRGLVLDVQPVDLLAGDGRQPGAELLALGGGRGGLEGQEFGGLEGFDPGSGAEEGRQRYGWPRAGGGGAGRLRPRAGESVKPTR